MPSLGDVFGEGSTARQLLVWQVLAQVIAALGSPGFTELTKLANRAAPVVQLPPDSAAAAVARGHVDHGAGSDAARDSGIPSEVFDILVRLAAHAPDLSIAFELYRRKVIGMGSPTDSGPSLAAAIRDSGIPDSWSAEVAKLATSIPTSAEVLNAWLEGQITESEAHRRLIESGMDPTWIQSAYNANGQAPTPTQALELLNRGIIPRNGTGPSSVSYEQAFLEGPWRNKWLGPFLALAEYLPPPRTVTAMYHQAQITHAQAAELLAKQGLAPDLVAAYLSKSNAPHTATDKHLAKAEVVNLYVDGLMTKAQALSGLEALRYSSHDAALILSLADVRAKTAQMRNGVTRVRTLYEAGKLTAAAAEHLLVELGTVATQAQAIVATWRLTASTKTRTLSASQIESAVYYELITPEAGISELVRLGYDEADAWLSLAVRFKGTTGLPPRPPGLPPAPAHHPTTPTAGA